jgi:hypothetical protein
LLLSVDLTNSIGSILVVGGEEGSNGYPVPSIEVGSVKLLEEGLILFNQVLPKPEGGPTYVRSDIRLRIILMVLCQIDMDWLLRTDPNNLYPFLFVLPGGGIFVLYYNEVRVLLDPKLSIYIFF